MKEHAHFAAASSVLADLRSDSNRVTRRAAGGHRKTDRRAVSGNFCHDASEPEHDLARFYLAVLGRPGRLVLDDGTIR